MDVPSLKLIEGQIKELQVVVSTPLRAENDQKSPGRIGLRSLLSLVSIKPITTTTMTIFK